MQFCICDVCAQWTLICLMADLCINSSWPPKYLKYHPGIVAAQCMLLYESMNERVCGEQGKNIKIQRKD